jgi:rubrerythrin
MCSDIGFGHALPIKKERYMSKTADNLKTAFAGESEARNKYTFFAEVARKEGYLYIARIFEETAENERQHAKITC